MRERYSGERPLGRRQPVKQRLAYEHHWPARKRDYRDENLALNRPVDKLIRGLQAPAKRWRRMASIIVVMTLRRRHVRFASCAPRHGCPAQIISVTL